MSATIASPPASRLVPPLNFAPVERGLYRSGQPAAINIPFLETLHLKSIIWLAVEDPSDVFLDFADQREITLHHLGVTAGGSNPWDQLRDDSLLAALSLITRRAPYPLLVCCGMGRHRTGTVIGCLRRLQRWNQASISDEYRRFAGARGGRVLIELRIESFDVDAVDITDDPPAWLATAQSG